VTHRHPRPALDYDRAAPIPGTLERLSALLAIISPLWGIFR
jgi:hypothetical protein